MTTLAHSVSIGGTTYAASTDHTAMPAAVVDEIRNPGAWTGGTAPALSATPLGLARIGAADLSTGTRARAALAINLDMTGGHVIPTTGSAPTVAAQAAMGTSPTATVAGRDTAGIATLTTGSGSPATGAQAIITFATAFAVAPVATVSPASAVAAARDVYVTATTTTLTIGFAAAGAASTAYVFNYHVIGK